MTSVLLSLKFFLKMSCTGILSHLRPTGAVPNTFWRSHDRRHFIAIVLLVSSVYSHLVLGPCWSWEFEWDGSVTPWKQPSAQVFGWWSVNMLLAFSGLRSGCFMLLWEISSQSQIFKWKKFPLSFLSSAFIPFTPQQVVVVSCPSLSHEVFIS